MASETYYFFFSLIFVGGVFLYIINLFYLRVKGKTTFGQLYKPGTQEYRRVIELTKGRNLLIAVIIALIFIANLTYDINRITHIADRSYVQGILTYAPIATVLFFILMIFMIRKQFRNYPFNKRG